MNRNWPAIFLVVGAFFWGGCHKPAAVEPKPLTIEDILPKAAQPKLPTIKLWLGAQEITAEMAITTEAERAGMMFRTNIAENEGMIFVLPLPQRASFWMKNCVIPLSCAYIDSDGVILETHDMQPHNTNSIVAGSENIRFVLETKQGWFERNNVTTGMVVRTERGTLAETFLR